MLSWSSATRWAARSRSQSHRTSSRTRWSRPFRSTPQVLIPTLSWRTAPRNTVLTSIDMVKSRERPLCCLRNDRKIQAPLRTSALGMSPDTRRRVTCEPSACNERDGPVFSSRRTCSSPGTRSCIQAVRTYRTNSSRAAVLGRNLRTDYPHASIELLVEVYANEVTQRIIIREQRTPKRRPICCRPTSQQGLLLFGRVR